MATRQLEVVSTPARAASVARQDRRMYRRYDLSLPLTVRRADIGRAVEGRTRDLSSRGVYFLAEDVFVPGCRIDLTVSLARAGLDHPGSFIHEAHGTPTMLSFSLLECELLTVM